MNEDITRKIEAIRQKPSTPEQTGEGSLDQVIPQDQRPEQPFRADYEAEKLTDQVTQIMTKPGTHREAGIDLPPLIPEKDRPAKLQQVISKTPEGQVNELMARGYTGEVTPYNLNIGLESSLPAEDKKAA